VQTPLANQHAQASSAVALPLHLVPGLECWSRCDIQVLLSRSEHVCTLSTLIAKQSSVQEHSGDGRNFACPSLSTCETGLL
jgi:hypothetical protein